MMTTELVFTVDGSQAQPARPISLAEAGLRERRDLQEWFIAHPEILGPEIKIVGFEFDQWRSYDGSRELDRLDVLGIDSDGRLVVAELKRDKAPDTVHMQAIKYAAMASRCVAVIDVSDGQPPLTSVSGAVTPETTDTLRHQQDMERERSLLYVAATRARDQLSVSWHGTPSPIVEGVGS